MQLQEKAERTSAKVPLYPPAYHTKQYSGLYHTPYAADYFVWLDLKVQKHTWDNYDRIWGKGQEGPYPPGASLIKVGDEHPQDGHTHREG